MKHNSHIYIASKAIEFLNDAVDNLRYPNGAAAPVKIRRRVQRSAVDLQRLLRHHQGTVVEASWAPDDVLNDKSLYHTFKLYTAREFADPGDFAAEKHERDGTIYYRIKGGGGLPYKVDHLARIIADMTRLRAYNDHFDQKQIMYLYMLISHYVADAHVPMHCDLRDDPPSKSDTSKPGPASRYYTQGLHGRIEELWDKACTPLAVAERIVVADTFEDYKKESALTPSTHFSLKDKEHVKLIGPRRIGERDMMNFMIDICVQAKQRSLQLFPVDNPTEWDTGLLPALTREIFADAISNLISIYLWMWGEEG